MAEQPRAGAMGSGPDDGRELRVALAMRGGVSLAVWIGGAVAELDLARRALADPDSLERNTGPERERGRAYADLLTALGYTSIRFDVLAGASAGGLNAVIYGFAQSIGTDLEWLLAVWQRQGDLWRLFHPQWAPGRHYRTEAVFDADSNFYRPLLEALRAASAGTSERLRSDFLTIDLSATLQAGPPLPATTTGTDIRPRAAHFRFQHTPGRPGGPFDDLPGNGSDPGADEEARRRLAYAARSTSSFPGAFEPATIHAWEGGPVRRPRGEGDDRPENMAGVFSDVLGDPGTAFDVMDGGVFDNIPIARALHAITDSPATGRTRRVLLYLDPRPPEPAAPPHAPAAGAGEVRPRRVRFLRSVVTALRYKVTTESSWDDLADLADLAARGTDQEFRRKQFLGSLPPDLLGGLRDLDPSVLRTLLDSYRDFRVRTDADRFTRLLTHPGEGFLQTLITPPAVAAGLGMDEAGAVRTDLEAALAGRAGFACHEDAAALAEAADFFIAWLRIQQDDPETARNGELTAALAGAKGSLYRVRTLAQYAGQRGDAAAVRIALGAWNGPGEAGGSPRRGGGSILAALPAVALALWPAAPLTVPPIDLDDEAALWRGLEAWGEGADRGGPHAPPESALTDPIAAGWRVLCAAVGDVQRSRLPAEVAGAPTLAELQRLVARATCVIGRLGTTAIPDFDTLSGDEEPLVPLAGVTLQSEARRLDRQAAHPERVSPWPSGAVHAGAKLSGSQLGNFGGFLAQDWRGHDWRWGRVDAGAGLVRTLTAMDDGASLRERERDPLDAAEVARAAAASREHLAAAYEGLEGRPGRLGDLTAERRYALGARLGLGLQRALWPVLGSGVRGFVVAAILTVLRPLLVLAPLVLRPAVLTAVAVAAAVATHAGPAPGTSGTLEPGTVALVGGLAAVVLALGVAAATGRMRTWRSLAGRAENSGEAAQSLCRRVVRAAARARSARVVLLVIVLLVVVADLWRGGGRPLPRLTRVQAVLTAATWFDVVVVLAAILVWALGSHRAVGRVDPAGARDRSGLTVALVASAAVLAATIAEATWWHRAGGVATGLAVGVLVWAVLHGWARRPLAHVLAVAAGIATALPDLPSPVARVAEAGATWGLPILSTIVVVVVVPAVAVGVVLALVFAGRWLQARLGRTGEVVASLLVLVATVRVAAELTIAWPWLGTIPAPLVLGAFACAAATLIVPFRDAEDLPAL
ncbi:DUF3376 domain-containing protein [Pseudactinotalea sp. HY160]|uniref:DUF3376 domain-containing protein n=1 Tax=Pseudactinotalea sp. HY160 TaxID=2654490 RepID=UPI0018841627|nr:DUF3376 domain-containing protein [Pseudactinotalea sp. HY160]